MTTTTTARMAPALSPPSPRPGTPCTENSIDQPMSPSSQSNLSSPTPSDSADCATSDSSGFGSFSSRAPTPQCLPLDDLIPENDAISQEEICQYLDIARSLIVDAQGRAATPCSGLSLGPQDTGMFGDSAQSQSSKMLNSSFDWPMASTMALDELPDSDLWYRPEYQLTQEWLEHTMKYLKEVDEEKRVAAEIEVDKRDEVVSDMETG